MELCSLKFELGGYLATITHNERWLPKIARDGMNDNWK